MAQPVSLSQLWQAIENPETSQDGKLEALRNLSRALSDRLDSLEASQTMLALQTWMRQLECPELTGAALGVLERIRPVSSVALLIDVALGDTPPVLEDMNLSSDEKMGLRIRAVRTLGLIGDKRAVIPLMSLLNNQAQNYRLRMAAAESLGRLGDNHAVESLVGILRNEEESSIYLRESSARALGMLGDLRAVDALLEVLNSKQGLRNKMNFLKERVIHTIGSLIRGDRAQKDVLSSLVLALNDDAPSIRQAAVEAIGELEDEQWVSVLIPRLSDNEPLVAEAAVASIYELGGTAALERILQDDDLPAQVKEDIEAYLADDEEAEDDD